MAALSRTLALPIGTLANPTLRLWVGKQVADDGPVVLRLLALAYASMATECRTRLCAPCMWPSEADFGLNLGSGILLTVLRAVSIPAFGLRDFTTGRIVDSPLLAIPYFVASHNLLCSQASLGAAGAP
jgi:hypothetical protein